jgi:hypothetical protein
VHVGVHWWFKSGERASETQQYENRLSQNHFYEGKKTLEDTLNKGFYYFKNGLYSDHS